MNRRGAPCLLINDTLCKILFDGLVDMLLNYCLQNNLENGMFYLQSFS
jgi:hypothetical protein